MKKFESLPFGNRSRFAAPMSARFLALMIWMVVVASIIPVKRAAYAQAQATEAKSAPLIDGSDADAAWADAKPITEFRMFQPTENGEPRFKTEARVVNDASNIYVFIRAFDPHPDSIISLLSRRDVKTQSDQLKIMLDSYHDRRTGYEFAVNPAGVKRDYYLYQDTQEDATWMQYGTSQQRSIRLAGPRSIAFPSPSSTTRPRGAACSACSSGGSSSVTPRRSPGRSIAPPGQVSRPSSVS